ncbi:hypothetical protein VaNZ11_010599 [Volvox africanus]|uniref:STI1/HOP DP domain-containing protein n=1 Tax=Volvox africanus TaxID=51714 RepID=A0ABQ5SAI1_9CHLO|nr:hypothetical protein VaNZ11_010599 [Volvox africanus]
MKSLARLVLSPAFLVRRAGVEATKAAAAASGTCSRAFPASLVTRHWSSSSPPKEDALRKAERMVELMGQSTQLQQIMMNVLPGPLRNPDVFKQLFGDPAMRRRIAEIIAARGHSIPDHLLERMSPAAMDDTFARASRLGLDPSQLFSKLMAHPGLLAKLQQPRVMAAFLDISEDPSRQAKYEGDKELLEVVQKVREIMGSSKPPVVPAASAATAATIELPELSTPSPATISHTGRTDVGDAISRTVPPPPGQPPQVHLVMLQNAEAAGECGSQEGLTHNNSGSSVNPLVALMASDPKAKRWLDNPVVMAALDEVHKSPWKTVKYIFNRDVMEAFKDLKELMRGR